MPAVQPLAVFSIFTEIVLPTPIPGVPPPAVKLAPAPIDQRAVGAQVVSRPQKKVYLLLLIERETYQSHPAQRTSNIIYGHARTVSSRKQEIYGTPAKLTLLAPFLSGPPLKGARYRVCPGVGRKCV